METRWVELVQRLQDMFPESDGMVLAALIEKTDTVARYIAQLHDLTIAEATEGVEWVIENFAFTGDRVLAAE